MESNWLETIEISVLTHRAKHCRWAEWAESMKTNREVTKVYYVIMKKLDQFYGRMGSPELFMNHLNFSLCVNLMSWRKKQMEPTGPPNNNKFLSSSFPSLPPAPAWPPVILTASGFAPGHAPTWHQVSSMFQSLVIFLLLSCCLSVSPYFLLSSVWQPIRLRRSCSSVSPGSRRVVHLKVVNLWCQSERMVQWGQMLKRISKSDFGLNQL